jgi:hypothetical protein
MSIFYYLSMYYSHEYEIYYFSKKSSYLVCLDSGKSKYVEGLTLLDSEFSDGFSPNLPIDGNSWA